MSTQGIIGFVVDGNLYTTVNVFDSYPSRLGKKLLRWAQNVQTTEGWDAERDRARALRLVNKTDIVTEADAKHLNAVYPKFGGRVTSSMAYGQVLSNLDYPDQLEGGLIVDAAGFPLNSLECEWGYIFDFDEERFEVYMGYQLKEHESGRFATGGYHATSSSGTPIYPIKLVSAWYFDGLPSVEQFIETVESKAVRERKVAVAS